MNPEVPIPWIDRGNDVALGDRHLRRSAFLRASTVHSAGEVPAINVAIPQSLGSR